MLKERRKSKRGVRFQEVETMHPLIALKVLHHILEHPLNRLSALPKNKHHLISLANNMEKLKVSQIVSAFIRYLN